MFIFYVLGIENLMKFDPNIAKMAEFTVEKQKKFRIFLISLLKYT
jgi:hypothetical protein